jgi:hypothetical protein
VERNRTSGKLVIWGCILFLIACTLPLKDKFETNSGGQQRIITRQDIPLIYWGVELMILSIAIFLCAYGFYQNRKKLAVFLFKQPLHFTLTPPCIRLFSAHEKDFALAFYPYFHGLCGARAGRRHAAAD